MEQNKSNFLRKSYGDIAAGAPKQVVSQRLAPGQTAASVGYTQEEMALVPPEANLGLGCGNPFHIVEVQQGQTVMDLGSGAGFDCFLAAKYTGRAGHVIGVDMTPEMLDKARGIAKAHRMRNVEFRLGEIENLPAGDNTADVVISTCVINLSRDKARVYREIFRVLKPGGRIGICDIVIMKELTKEMKESDAMYAC